MKKIFSIFGWVGVLFITGTYFFISFGILSAENLMYQILNLLGAVLIAISSYSKKDMQPVILNIFWALIALFSILRIFYENTLHIFY